MNSYLRVYAEIDLDAIRDNIREIKRHIGTKTKLMAIIKADGYGHGSVPIANALRDEGVDGFGVAIIEEGILLRKRGIKQPILILGYTSQYQYAELIQYELTQTVFQYSMAESISKFAVTMGRTARIHIALDTGMNRIGFQDTEESVEVIKRIQKLPNLVIEGIFTHFSKADELDKTFTFHQMDRFHQFVEKLEKNGVHIPIKHASNSAGIIDFNSAHLDMVRSGIITYGLYPSKDVGKEQLKIQPALELKSHVIYRKRVPAGESVSYGGTYVTDRETVIATIPVGYGDGYPRALSSKGRVLIHGQYAPIIGRVCMDQFMVDITHIPDVKQEDIVTLVGRDGDNCITVEEVANLAGSFNYEFCCGLGRRVPRVYIEKGEMKQTIDYLND